MTRELVTRLVGKRSAARVIPASLAHEEPETAAAPATEAAVLVPLIDRPEGMTVLLTRRTDHLTDHAGQVSFPGGRIEPGDAGPIDAALRETAEEIGLQPSRIEVIGCLDICVTGTGFRVVPVVGLVSTPFDVAGDLILDAFEVADAFEVPLSFVLDEANHVRRVAIARGARREFYVLSYQDRYIWGATARMLVNLHEVLRGAS
jgi:8-oxo-dGTP pyrophosphatase MutT (NUDIX family)